jgi:hypothetical protein
MARLGWDNEVLGWRWRRWLFAWAGKNIRGGPQYFYHLL